MRLLPGQATDIRARTHLNFKRLVWCGCVLLGGLLAGCAALADHQPAACQGIPRNVILFIGDGMGVSQVTAAKVARGRLRMEEFPTIGLLSTHAADTFLTDSAAAATALASGEQTLDGVVGLSPEKRVLKTAMEYAAERGKSIGIVVTSAVTDATPAAFVAHVEDRDYQEAIAEQIVQSRLSVIFGGGWAYFLPRTMPGGDRHDNRNLLAELASRMTVVTTAQGFQALGAAQPAAALFAPKALPPAKERTVSLAEMTRKALAILSHNEQGFFLMVEGSQIDGGGHINEFPFLVEETVDFDEAVGIGLDFTRTNLDTLIIVTADHETGGFALHDGSVANRIVTGGGFTTTGHTGTMVPLFAHGPGSGLLGGMHENTFVGQQLVEFARGACGRR
jgi:alkaline phosphatase